MIHKFYTKHILSIDFGTKRIGLASFKPGNDPFPLLLPQLNNNSLNQTLSSLKQIISDECIDFVVLGVPYLLDGQTTKKTLEILDFKKTLQEAINIPVYEQDETLSTITAKERMKNSPRFNFKIDLSYLDSVAATIILEDFLTKMQGNKGSVYK